VRIEKGLSMKKGRSIGRFMLHQVRIKGFEFLYNSFVLPLLFNPTKYITYSKNEQKKSQSTLRNLGFYGIIEKDVGFGTVIPEDTD